MNKSLFITRAIPEAGVALLRAKGYRVDIYPKDRTPTQKELIGYLKQYPYDAVLCTLSDTIDAKLFDAVPTAKIFATYTVGYNNIDLAEAKKRSITITNTAGSSQIPVAEHAMALMLGLTTRMVEADAVTRKGGHKEWAPMAFVGTDIKGATLGLIGTGAIGTEAARMAHQAFGMQIMYHDLNQNELLEKEYGATKAINIEAVLSAADVVSLHVPLMDATHHLINAERLALMKPTAFLINTARGPLIDEKALVAALKNKTIAGAGLDVFEYEPKLSKGLAKLHNVVLTPHIASARISTRNRMAEIAAESIIDFFEGRTPHTIVHN